MFLLGTLLSYHILYSNIDFNTENDLSLSLINDNNLEVVGSGSSTPRRDKDESSLCVA
jgi:hypothetical protein